MRIEQYKRERLEDVKYYLRGINYKNLKSDKVVFGLHGDMDTIFNNKVIQTGIDGETTTKLNAYRVCVNEFLLKLRNAYDSLIADDLEFAYTKQEVDTGIFKFEVKLIELIRDFKNKMLQAFCIQSGYNANVINNDLSFIRIKIRDRIEVASMTSDDLHAENELNGLREIFLCIYTLMQMIKDKKIKMDLFLDMVNVQYKVNEPEYAVMFRRYLELKNKQDYDSFVAMYDKDVNEMLEIKGKKLQK